MSAQNIASFHYNDGNVLLRSPADRYPSRRSLLVLDLGKSVTLKVELLPIEHPSLDDHGCPANNRLGCSGSVCQPPPLPSTSRQDHPMRSRPAMHPTGIPPPTPPCSQSFLPICQKAQVPTTRNCLRVQPAPGRALHIDFFRTILT